MAYDLKACLAHELANAAGGDGSRLSRDRQQAMGYYNGDPFEGETADTGRSTVVMRTVMENVEWVIPALLRIFTASDRIAVIEPLREADVDAAKQATEFVNWVFNVQNQGFMVLHDWFKDALLLKLGWVKRWWDPAKRQEVRVYTGLLEEQYQALLADPNVEVLEQQMRMLDAYEIALDRPVPAAIAVYDCRLLYTLENGRIRVQTVPPEEVLFSRRARRDYLPFACHRTERTISELIELGYDEDTLKDAPLNEIPISGERVERYIHDDQPESDERTDFPMSTVWVEESYIRYDRNGDNVAELLKIVSVNGGQLILTKQGQEDIEEIDEIPLVSICPVPSPHKLVGNSLADLVMDLQYYKSVLIRQMLDNIYLANMPEVIVGADAIVDETYDDLLNRRPGGVIRARNAAGIVPHTVPFVAGHSFPLIEYFDQTAEVRTGVARHNQGLNPDDLNKTATGVNLIQQAAAQRVELIARIFAEGVRELVRGILQLIQRHQQQELVIRVTGRDLRMDPRDWPNALTATVSVGLGTGNRDAILKQLMTILQIQQGIVQIQGGVHGPLVTAQNVYDVLEHMTANAGFKESFFTDPSQPPAPGTPPPGARPDPQMAHAQAKIQTEMMMGRAKVEAQQQKSQTDAYLQQQRAASQMDLERQKAANDMMVAQERERARAERELMEIQLRARSGAYTADDRLPPSGPPRPNGNGRY